MEDLNSFVGEGWDGIEVGSYGLERRNDREEKLVKFCKRNKFMVKCLVKMKTNYWLTNSWLLAINGYGSKI